MNAAPTTPQCARANRSTVVRPAISPRSRRTAEARGMTRDAVRMLVAERATGRLVHTSFGALPTFLQAGDLVVINTSAVVPAAVTAWDDHDNKLVVHLSTRLDDGRWVIELRRIDGHDDTSVGRAGSPSSAVPAKTATITLDAPYLDSSRLWVAQLDLPQPVFTWLAVHGQPIRYALRRPAVADRHVSERVRHGAGQRRDAECRSTLHARGHHPTRRQGRRRFTAGAAHRRRIARGDELPYPERLRVPAPTASRVNETHRNGGRVIAVGTTVVRGLETAGGRRRCRPAHRRLDRPRDHARARRASRRRTVDRMARTGGIASADARGGRRRDRCSKPRTTASLDEGYLWHEFGDMHLILP